jgi:cytochrome c
MYRNTLLGCLVASTLAANIPIARATQTATQSNLIGDPGRGKNLYQGCQACHSIEDNDLGPRHRGVVGRHAGSVADYNYSQALKNSGLTWDAATLDRWLSNPSALVPGTKMYFKLDDPQARADVIAFLGQLK